MEGWVCTGDDAGLLGRLREAERGVGQGRPDHRQDGVTLAGVHLPSGGLGEQQLH